MPCTKCENGKYKWGKTGECKYDSKEECEKANPKKYSKMKPTPLGKKSYEEYEKELKEFNLSKVERVELGSIDDLKKYSQGVDKYQNEGDGLIKRGNRLLSELKETQTAIFKWSDVGESIANDLSSELVKVEKAAKELGVNPSSIKEIANANKAFKQYAKLEQKYQKAAKDLIK